MSAGAAPAAQRGTNPTAPGRETALEMLRVSEDARGRRAAETPAYKGSGRAAYSGSHATPFPVSAPQETIRVLMERKGGILLGRRTQEGTPHPPRTWKLLEVIHFVTRRHHLPPPVTAGARPPPSAPRSRRGPAEPPAPGPAASITFMPRLPEHRPAGMDGGRAAGGCVPVSPGAGTPAPPARCKHTPAAGGGWAGGQRHGNPAGRGSAGVRGAMLAGGSGLAVMLREVRSRHLLAEPGPAHPSPRHPASQNRCLAWQVQCWGNILDSSSLQCKPLGMQRREMS